MSLKKRGLNKGLDSLLGDLKSFRERNLSQDEFQNKTDSSKQQANNPSENHLIEIDIELVKPNPNQPRKLFNIEQINQLAQSIQSEGIIQPLIVSKKNQHYIIIAGERRYRASLKIGLKKVPCVVKKVSEDSAELMSLIENLQREDLNPIEVADSFNLLIAKYGYTHQKLANQLGMSRSQVTNTLRLQKLVNPVKQALIDKKIEVGQARVLVALDYRQQATFCKKIIQNNLNTREVEKLIQSQLSSKNKLSKQSKTETKDANLLNLEQKLSDKLTTQVKIKHQNSGKGMIQIYYHSLESLDEILKKIK